MANRSVTSKVLEQASNDFITLKSIVREAELTDTFDLSVLRSAALLIQTRWSTLETLNVTSVIQVGLTVSRPFGLETFVADVESYLLSGPLDRIRLVLGSAIAAEFILRSAFPLLETVYELIEAGLLSGVPNQTTAATQLNSITQKLIANFPQLGSVITDTRDVDRYLRALDLDFPKLMLSIAPESNLGGDYVSYSHSDFVGLGGSIYPVGLNIADISSFGEVYAKTAAGNPIAFLITLPVGVNSAEVIFTVRNFLNGTGFNLEVSNVIAPITPGMAIARGANSSMLGQKYVVMCPQNVTSFLWTSPIILGAVPTLVVNRVSMSSPPTTIIEAVASMVRYDLGSIQTTWILRFVAEIETLKKESGLNTITKAINDRLNVLVGGAYDFGPYVIFSMIFWTQVLGGLPNVTPTIAKQMYRLWFVRLAGYVNAAASDTTARKFLQKNFDY